MESQKINRELAEQILTVGPDNKNYRGGIGAVLDVYQEIFPVFHFIPTYRYHKNNYRKILFFAGQLQKIIFSLFSKKIRSVHLHSSHGASFYRKFIVFYISKNWFHKKIIFHLHSSTFGEFYKNSGARTKKMIEYLFRHIDMFICVSAFWQQYYTSVLPVKKSWVINNPINPACKIKEYYSRENAPLKLLFLGKITAAKGIFDLLEVLATYKDQFDQHITLTVGGDGEVEKLERLVSQYSLENMVTYAGWVEGNYKESLLMQSDIFVLPTYHEGMPVSILEAMSYGLPVISTQTGGIPEIVEQEINGILHSPGNIAALKDAILYFIIHPEKIPGYGAASREKIKDYTPAAVARALTDCYNTIL